MGSLALESVLEPALELVLAPGLFRMGSASVLASVLEAVLELVLVPWLFRMGSASVPESVLELALASERESVLASHRPN
jgi:hypothetical protein